MQYDIRREVTAEFGEPDAHFFETRRVGDAVAEDTGVRTSVIESRYTPAMASLISFLSLNHYGQGNQHRGWRLRKTEQRKQQPKPLLPSRIPNLQPHNRITLIIHYTFREKARSHRARCARRLELILHISTVHSLN